MTDWKDFRTMTPQQKHDELQAQRLAHGAQPPEFPAEAPSGKRFDLRATRQEYEAKAAARHAINGDYPAEAHSGKRFDLRATNQEYEAKAAARHAMYGEPEPQVLPDARDKGPKQR